MGKPGICFQHPVGSNLYVPSPGSLEIFSQVYYMHTVLGGGGFPVEIFEGLNFEIVHLPSLCHQHTQIEKRLFGEPTN